MLRSDKVDVVTRGLVLQLQHKVRNLLCLLTRDQMFSPMLRIRIRVDPHHFGKLDPDPDPHESGKLDPDLYPQQSEKVGSLRWSF